MYCKCLNPTHRVANKLVSLSLSNVPQWTPSWKLLILTTESRAIRDVHMHVSSINRNLLSPSLHSYSSSGFPCVRVRLVYWSLRCTATCVSRFHWSLFLAFSFHFSSPSAFLRSLFTQSSHLSCGLPGFLQPSCFFVSDLFGILSYFILTMCPAHFILLLTLPAVLMFPCKC